MPFQSISLSPSAAPPVPHDDSHLSIDIKKGTRSYTQHLIANHVYNDSLSPKFRVFSTSLSSISISCSVSQTLSQP